MFHNNMPLILSCNKSINTTAANMSQHNLLKYSDCKCTNSQYFLSHTCHVIIITLHTGSVWGDGCQKWPRPPSRKMIQFDPWCRTFNRWIKTKLVGVPYLWWGGTGGIQYSSYNFIFLSEYMCVWSWSHFRVVIIRPIVEKKEHRVVALVVVSNKGNV